MGSIAIPSSGGTVSLIKQERVSNITQLKASTKASIMIYSCYLYGNNISPTTNTSPIWSAITDRSRTYVFFNVSPNQLLLTFDSGSGSIPKTLSYASYYE